MKTLLILRHAKSSWAIAHLSDHEPMRHTNQIVGTGFTPVAETLGMLKVVDADEKAKRFGCDELVVSFELGFPGDQIDNPDAWVRQSIRHVQEVAPFIKNPPLEEVVLS